MSDNTASADRVRCVSATERALGTSVRSNASLTALRIAVLGARAGTVPAHPGAEVRRRARSTGRERRRRRGAGQCQSAGSPAQALGTSALQPASLAVDRVAGCSSRGWGLRAADRARRLRPDVRPAPGRVRDRLTTASRFRVAKFGRYVNARERGRGHRVSASRPNLHERLVWSRARPSCANCASP